MAPLRYGDDRDILSLLRLAMTDCSIRCTLFRFKRFHHFEAYYCLDVVLGILPELCKFIADHLEGIVVRWSGVLARFTRDSSGANRYLNFLGPFTQGFG